MANEISPDSLVSRRTILFLWLATIFVVSITFLVIYFKKSASGGSVALHYNVITGVDVLGPSRNLYILPLAGLVIGAVNFVIYRSLLRRTEFLSFLTAVVSLSAALFLFAAAVLVLTIA